MERDENICLDNLKLDYLNDREKEEGPGQISEAIQHVEVV